MQSGSSQRSTARDAPRASDDAGTGSVGTGAAKVAGTFSGLEDLSGAEDVGASGGVAGGSASVAGASESAEATGEGGDPTTPNVDITGETPTSPVPEQGVLES